ncbi:hypothetical protein HK100_012209 [Physocladia obscura]|uniref:Uncharacterized protein n=1 Tax=Physocladia obscura TaxID=109957 RepID=A0AAD5XKK4_9FUNG|nr:hypothetical protein HK100_012209 [Physocladia obscura]
MALPNSEVADKVPTINSEDPSIIEENHEVSGLSQVNQEIQENSQAGNAPDEQTKSDTSDLHGTQHDLRAGTALAEVEAMPAVHPLLNDTNDSVFSLTSNVPASAMIIAAITSPFHESPLRQAALTFSQGEVNDSMPAQTSTSENENNIENFENEAANQSENSANPTSAQTSPNTVAPIENKEEAIDEIPEVLRELHFQLIPFTSQGQQPNQSLECIERKVHEGEVVRIGRKVVKNGVEQLLEGQKDSLLNIWYQSKVVSRCHAEIWIADGQLFIKDVGSSSGTFLNKMRLSPSGKESPPYTIRENDLVVFGVDYKGKSDDDLYKCISVRIGFYDNTWIKQLRKKADPKKFQKALKQLLNASNPHAAHTDDDDGSPPEDCCICIGEIQPLQAIFIAPCSHCYHYKCVNSILIQSQMFQCPMCRQVANLAASVSTESLEGKAPLVNGLLGKAGIGADGHSDAHNRAETAVPPDDGNGTASPVAHSALPHHITGGSSNGSNPSLNSVTGGKLGWGKTSRPTSGVGKKMFGGLFGGKKKDDSASTGSHE